MNAKTMIGLAVCGLLLASPAASGADRTRKSAEAIRACARSNAPQKTMVQRLIIESVSAAGGTRRMRATLYYQRFGPAETRITLQVHSPAGVAGTSYLIVDRSSRDSLYVYLPALDQVRRITGAGASGSLLGTDFSYADLKQIRAMSAGGELARLPDGEVAGRPVYRLALTPPGHDSVYRRLVFAIDRKTCVPLRIQFFRAGDEPVKRYTADPASLVEVGGHWFAKRATMRDVEAGTRTRVIVQSAEFDPEVPDTLFDRRLFHLGAHTAPRPAPPASA